MSTNNFQDDLQIDPNQLDVEAGMQAELFYKWAEKSVQARKDHDKAKFDLEVCTARLSGQARVDPDSFGITKVTEAAIDVAVKTHPDYTEAYEEFLSCKANMALMDKATEAMEQRKRMIEVLITLHGQQYFAGPSVPRNLTEAWCERKEQRSGDVVTKQKKKARVRRRRDD